MRSRAQPLSDLPASPHDSSAALPRCIAFALVYGWIVFFVSWGMGGPGEVAGRRLLADPAQPARLVGALSAIIIPLLALAMGQWLGKLERAMKLALVRRSRRFSRRRRSRLRVADFERLYRRLLSIIFGAVLLALLLWHQRGDVTAFIILFSWLAIGPVAGIAIARRIRQPALQAPAAMIAGMGAVAGAIALIMSFAGAGVAAFAFAVLGVTQVAFMGAAGMLLSLVMGGALTLGLMIAGAGAATVALALAGAGTGLATLTGVATMSRAGLAAFAILMSGASIAAALFGDAAVISGAIGGVTALSVAGAVSHARLGRKGAYAGAAGLITLMIGIGTFLGWGGSGLLIFAATFFVLLPLAAGVACWLSLLLSASFAAITRRYGKAKVGLPVFLTLAVPGAAGIGLLEASLLGFVFASFDYWAQARSGETALLLTATIDSAVAAPFGDQAWLTALLALPILPVLWQILRFPWWPAQGNHPSDGSCLDKDSYPGLQRLIGLGTAAAVLFALGLVGILITLSDVADLTPLVGEAAHGGARAAWQLWR